MSDNVCCSKVIPQRPDGRGSSVRLQVYINQKDCWLEKRLSNFPISGGNYSPAQANLQVKAESTGTLWCTWLLLLPPSSLPIKNPGSKNLEETWNSIPINHRLIRKLLSALMIPSAFNADKVIIPFLRRPSHWHCWRIQMNLQRIRRKIRPIQIQWWIFQCWLNPSAARLVWPNKHSDGISKQFAYIIEF